MGGQLDSILAQGAKNNNDMQFKQGLLYWAKRMYPNMSGKEWEQYCDYKNASDEIQYRLRMEALDRIEKSNLEVRLKSLEETKKRTISYSATKNRISLWIENNDLESVSFSENRAKYLIRMIGNGVKATTADDLKKIGTSKDFSNISNTITEINKRFNKLNPIEILIKKNSNGNGYLLSQKFIFNQIIKL